LQQIVRPLTAAACLWLAYRTPGFLLATVRFAGISPAAFVGGPLAGRPALAAAGATGGASASTTGPRVSAVRSNRDRFASITNRARGLRGTATTARTTGGVTARRKPVPGARAGGTPPRPATATAAATRTRGGSTSGATKRAQGGPGGASQTPTGTPPGPAPSASITPDPRTTAQPRGGEPGSTPVGSDGSGRRSRKRGALDARTAPAPTGGADTARSPKPQPQRKAAPRSAATAAGSARALQRPLSAPGAPPRLPRHPARDPQRPSDASQRPAPRPTSDQPAARPKPRRKP
jgi:hypothetical protein